MRSLALIPLMFCVAGIVLPQATTVRRTIATAPTQEDRSATDPSQASNPSDAQIRALIDNYRHSWDRMNDRTRKMMLSHGGQTPEQFEHTVRQRMFGQQQLASPIPTAALPGAKSAESNSSTQLNLDVLNTMATSTEDLTAIRDGNLKRVQGGGCAPQINARIADLKGKLAMYEHVLRPDAAVQVSATETPKLAARPSSSAAALANDWFTNRAETPAPTPGSNAAKRQLDSVLGDGSPEAPTVKATAPKSADTAEQRKEAEIEIARLKPELDRLTAACATAR